MGKTGAALEGSRSALAAMIRGLVVSQAETWRRVPYLALVAEQDEQVGGTLRRTYTDGLWHVAGRVHVDCRTGKLVDRGGWAVDDATLTRDLPAGDDVWRIDAEGVVEHLQEAAAGNRLVADQPLQVTEWRRRTAVAHKVTPVWGAHEDEDPGLRRQAETFERLAPEWHRDLLELWETIPSL